MKSMKIKDLRMVGMMMAKDKPTDLEEMGRIVGEILE